MLRRRTGELLSTLLIACVLAGLVGAAYVVWHDPPAALGITIVAAVLACAVCAMVDEFGWLAVALSTIFAVLGNGLYALHLLGIDIRAIALVASLLVGLVFVILGRALIAAGSADYPYDE